MSVLYLCYIKLSKLHNFKLFINNSILYNIIYLYFLNI